MSRHDESATCDYMIRAHQLCMDLNNILMLINSSHNVEEILHEIMEESCKALGSESARVAMREGENWVIRYVNKLPDDLVGRSFTDEDLPHAALALMTRKPVAIDDAFHDERTNGVMMQSLGIRSVLVLPLMEKTEIIGTLLFGYHSRSVSFTDTEIDYAGRVATGVAIALQNARLYQDLQRTGAELEESKRLGNALNEIDTLALENTRLLEGAKRSESSLKEAEKLGKSGHFHYEIGTRKITWSDGLFHLFRRDPALGEPTVKEFFGLYSMEPGLEAMTELVDKDETSEFDAKIKQNGLTEVFHFVVRSLKDNNGKRVAFFGTIQDITDRMRVEQLLRESKGFKQAILDSLPAHIAVLDQQGIIITVNRSWVRFAEQNSLPGVQSACAGADYLAVCRRAAEMSDPLALEALRGIEGVLAERLSTFTLNYPCHSPTQQRWFMMTVVGPSHGIRGAVITHVDITERMKAENELQEVNRELEAFDYTVAHDLRKPLTVINGYCQAVKELCGDQLTEECSGYVREAYEGTLRMNQLIDALMQFSRLAKAEPKRETVDLGAMAEEVAAELKLAEPERRVAFHISHGTTVEGDAELLRVILANLLGNAWKYTSNREEGIITFGTIEIDGKEAYFVRDNGVGLDMADVASIFTPFRQLPGADQAKGFGIGLATVERIIKRHGGKIWAEGERGKGTTIYFTL